MAFARELIELIADGKRKKKLENVSKELRGGGNGLEEVGEEEEEAAAKLAPSVTAEPPI